MNDMLNRKYSDASLPKNYFHQILRRSAVLSDTHTLHTMALMYKIQKSRITRIRGIKIYENT